MPVDYAEVLQDMEREEARLATQLSVLRQARPGVMAMLRAQQLDAAILAPHGKYVSMGPTPAMRDVLSSGELLTRDELRTRLKAEGWTTKSDDELSTISAALSQSKDFEKVGERWRLATDRNGSQDSVTRDSQPEEKGGSLGRLANAGMIPIPMNTDGPTYLRQRLATNAPKQGS